VKQGRRDDRCAGIPIAKGQSWLVLMVQFIMPHVAKPMYNTNKRTHVQQDGLRRGGHAVDGCLVKVFTMIQEGRGMCCDYITEW
jgi:hypothetical protein